MPPFAIIASGKTYGDYQILFDLQTNFDFKTYAHDFRWSELERKYLNKKDFGSKEYIVNTLDAQLFRDLCDLYPKTGLTL